MSNHLLTNDDIDDLLLEGFFVTPGEILERQNELKRAVDSLDYDIANNQNCLNDQFKAEWEQFKLDFSAYLEEYSGYLDRFWGSAADVAEKWAKQIEKWQLRFKASCNKAASGGPLSFDPNTELYKYLKYGLAIGGGLLTLFVGFKIYQAVKK